MARVNLANEHHGIVWACQTATFDEGEELGLDTSGYSFGYVASWAVGKTDEEMRACMQALRDATKDIIDKMEIVLAG